MSFSRGFKITYWIALIAVLTRFLWLRVDDAVTGYATAADIFVFAIWIALLLAPLYSEVEFFGVKLKQEIEKAKTEIGREVAQLRAEISNAVDVRTTVAPQFHMVAPPADSQLPAIVAQVKKAVDDAFASRSLSAPSSPVALDAKDERTEYMFWTRHDLEKELRRIAGGRDLLSATRRPIAGVQLARLLVQNEVLEPSLERAVREVYAVCSGAIHAEDPTAPQEAFVKEVGPQLIAALKAIQ